MELQRAPHIILYWRGDRLVLHNYALDRTVAAAPLVVDVLDRFHSWTRVEPYLESVGEHTRPSLSALIQAMARDRWLWQRGEPLLPAEREMDAWGGWNPAAGVFHRASRGVQSIGLEELVPRLTEQAKTWPMPPSSKRYDGVETFALPQRAEDDRFSSVVRERRTWRQFGDAPIELQALSTLLDLSAGVQHWAHADGEGRVALKTSPSGGARHPIEIYVAARRVSGLPPAFYHFDAERHELERLPAVFDAELDALLPMQWWYRGAGALVFMTGVFERTRWRYKSPRAYRAVLLEAGHVCQTFCLAATWLGLAPFCSMALADAAIEEALGIDGVSESVLYAAGVGTRPKLADGALPGTLPSVG